ncbi:flavin reductase family protein [Candidatus Bathyarchaeota archaeon]|nr:flavin reductase family protein [Candidatus Bathyarchaeota archaeon]
MSARISRIIYPRPTVLITTCNKNGRPNVAAFSFLMPISFEPKYVAFSVAPTRYTFSNLKEVDEFVVNVPTEDMLNEIWVCGTKSGKDVDKFDFAGLETVKSVKVRPPRIKKCPAQLECKVELLKGFGDHYLVVGKVLEEHISERGFKPILHYSGNEFYKLGEKIKS